MYPHKSRSRTPSIIAYFEGTCFGLCQIRATDRCRCQVHLIQHPTQAKQVHEEAMQNSHLEKKDQPSERQLVFALFRRPQPHKLGEGDRHDTEEAQDAAKNCQNAATSPEQQETESIAEAALLQ
jgi:hypothetical protein